MDSSDAAMTPSKSAAISDQLVTVDTTGGPEWCSRHSISESGLVGEVDTWQMTKSESRREGGGEREGEGKWREGRGREVERGE